MRYVSIDGRRTAYSPNDIVRCVGTMTVGELIDMLEDFDRSLPVILNNDRGYTYGEIVDYTISEEEYDGE